MRVNLSEAEVGIYSCGRLGKAKYTTAQYTIDVTGFRDPASNRGFKKRYPDGRAGEVQDYIAEDPRYQGLLDSIKLICYLNLRSEMVGSNKWLSFAIRDHHGKWAAPAITELVADSLAREGYQVGVFHHELL